MSAYEMVSRHVQAALVEAAKQSVSDDVVARCLLSEAICLFKAAARSNDDIAAEYIRSGRQPRRRHAARLHAAVGASAAAPARQARSASPTTFMVRSTLPGLTLIELMPISVTNRAISG